MYKYRKVIEIYISQMRVIACMTDNYPHYVELEGLEPSSKRGTNMLSTCLVKIWFSSDARLKTTKHQLILKKFESKSRLFQFYPRYNSTAGSESLGKKASGRCLVSAPCAEIKLTYCTSVRQRERSCFRQLKFQ